MTPYFVVEKKTVDEIGVQVVFCEVIEISQKQTDRNMRVHV